METISEYIHYNILRKMCDPQINQPNNNQANIHYKNPDIEMGYKLHMIPTAIKAPLKEKKFEPKIIDALDYKV